MLVRKKLNYPPYCFITLIKISSTPINQFLCTYYLYNKEKKVKCYFDIITCNPPYFKVIDSSRINDNNVKAIARHEILIKLEDIVSLAYKFLRDKGKLYIVYRPDRLMELLKLFDKYKFGVKKLQCCYNNSDSLSSMILIEAMKNGQDDLKILAPLYTENYRR